MPAVRRWPAWVYDTGTELDPRFSFANERTFLAWPRTSLALVTGGSRSTSSTCRLWTVSEKALAIVLVLLGLSCSLSSWIRWTRAERAMRRRQPLPSSPFTAVLVS